MFIVFYTYLHGKQCWSTSRKSLKVFIKCILLNFYFRKHRGVVTDTHLSYQCLTTVNRKKEVEGEEEKDRSRRSGCDREKERE